MSGGHLVVTDRAGRDSKRYSLPSGLVTVGSDSTCDIRMMLPAISAHHATVVVRANQAVIRNVSDGETLVNGEPISVAALQHGDTITLGDRTFRWEYSHPSAVKIAPPLPAVLSRGTSKGGAGGRRARGSAGGARRPLDAAVQLALEMRHRSSMPGAGKQVAVVQPQRRDTHDSIDANPRLVVKPHRPYTQTNKRQRASTTPKQDTERAEDRKRKSTPRATPSKMEQTKASMWIESRKSAPRMKSVSPKKSPHTPKIETPKTLTPKTLTPKTVTPKTLTPKTRTPRTVTPKTVTPKRSPAKNRSSITPKRAVTTKATPLRTLVLRKAVTPNIRNLKEYTPRKTQSVTKVAKIQAPLTIDHTKQAAIMLMARHTPKGPSLLVKKTSPNTPKITPKGRKSVATPKVTHIKSSARKSHTKKSIESLMDVDTPQNNKSRSRRSTASFVDADSSQSNRSGNRDSTSSLVDLDTPQNIRSTPNFADAYSSRNKSTRRSALSVEFETPKTNTTRGRSSASFADANSSQINKSVNRRSNSLVDIKTPINISRKKSSSIKAHASQSNQSVSLVDLNSPETNYSRSRNSTLSFVDADASHSKKSISRRSTTLLDDTTPNNQALGRKSRSKTTSPSNKPTSPSNKTTSPSNKSTSPSIKQRRSASATSFGDKSNVSTRGSKSLSPKRASSRYSGGDSVSILEISDTNRTSRSRKSPIAASPKKSSMKNPLAKTTRKTESIKFDLSNLENFEDESTDVFVVSNNTKKSSKSDQSDEDITLQYSDGSQAQSPSRRSLQSRSSKILQKTLGNSFVDTMEASTLTPKSPSARKSIRGSLIVAKALSTPEKSSYSTRTTKSVDSITSPRANKRKLESYSIVDLVSLNESKLSEYGSVASASTTFGTPRNSRKTRSTINPTLVDSSTPFAKGRQSRTTLSKTSDSFVFESGSPASKRSKSTSQIEKSGRQSRSKKNDSDVLIVSTRSASESSKSRGSQSPAQKSVNRSNKSILSLNISNASSNKTANTTNSPIINISRRSSRRNDVPTTPEDGMNTPENRISPPAVGTPVLNLQSLLDASNLTSKSPKQRQITANLKRKTIGATAGTSKAKSGKKLRSKSLNLSAAKRILRTLSNDSSNVSDKTDEGAQRPSIENITPRSTVKLVQEAVKEKHSTAKKSTSKRSIIDNLNDSDIVGQLFASPVKRKLSQSMTEFTRTQLEERPKRKRNTIAVTVRSPDNTLMENSRSYTPEVFVSPLNTPEASPNLSGIKRLYRKNTPQNDLTNVRGVKELIRTPRAKRSVQNDLTNVGGIKEVFAKSPRNRLSDLKGVKEVFTAATSPQNDLRRVSGVKSLFQSEKKRRGPKNDLTNVSGVKRLFRHIRSPNNDLRNISGVKKTLAKSPKNDLRDVRGVKRMFAKESTQNGLSNVSGVEELFNESYESHHHEASTSERVFDQLVGKPTLKSTYSKTFNKSTKKTPTKRSVKSLNTSIKYITNNVEEWIEKELQHRFNKSDSGKSKTKTPKTINRELQKLQTDTVEGTTPMQTSRARNSSTKVGETTRIKSASEIYSAHTLPIKKRSLAEKSLEKSISAKTILPIKKRALIHSTPVKGKFNLTANVSELGRVSPIVAERNDVTIIRPPTPKAKPPPKQKTSPPKKKQTTPKKKQATPKKNQVTPKKKVVTPKKKPNSPKKTLTPKAKRNTRAAKTVGPKEIEAELVSKPVRGKSAQTKSPKTPPKPRGRGKKAEPSLVIPKKSPVMSPKSNTTTTRRRKAADVTEKVESPKNPNKVAKKPVQPKKNAKEIEKVMSPPKRATRKLTEKAEKVVTPKKGRKVAEKVVTPKRNTRKTKVVTPKASPKKAAAQKKTKQAATPNRKSKAVAEKVATPKKNTRKAKDTPKPSPKKPGAQKKTRKATEKLETPKSSPVKGRRGRKNKENPLTPNIRVKASSIAIMKPSPQMKPEQKRRGRNVTKESPEKSLEKPKRARKTVSKAASTENVKTKSPVPKRNVTLEPAKGRKRKITEIEIPVTAPKRGRKTEPAKPKSPQTKGTKGAKGKAVVETEKETRRGRQNKSTVDKNETEIAKNKTEETKATRAQKKVVEKVTEKASPKKRGRKVQNTTADVPAARGRKRKSEEPPSPKKVPAKKARAAAARAKTDAAAAPAARSRRR